MPLRYYHFIYLATVTFVVKHCSGSSSTLNEATSAPLYKSVAALDQYGNSEQLQNAMLASSLYGSPVIATMSYKEGSVSVFSLCEPLNGVKSRPEYDKSIQIVTSSDDEVSTITALVCSGLKADANILLRILRDYASRLWERYDCIPDCHQISNALAGVLLSFMGYSTDDEPIPFVSHEFEMARPFGVHSLVLGIKPGCKPFIQSVDPSGVRRSWSALAIGRGNQEANQKLRKLYKKTLSPKEIQNICIDIIRDLYADDTKKPSEGSEILCETLTSRGIKINRIPFLKDNKQHD